MAEVYLAKSTGAAGISRWVAIKRILPQYSENPEFVEMFKEEAKIAVNLNHSNVVSIHEFGIQNAQFFLVMEYVEGQNLRQILNHLKKIGKAFSVDQIVYIIKEVAAGLDHAHRCIDGASGQPLNITHRDISPQNVMISFEGETKVVDFGIAKAETQVESTRTGTIKGKFGYMSPEQAEGEIVDLRTDVFSLGIVLWEMLSSERLFTSNSEAATLKKIRECQIPSLRKINPAIPPELERICNKALAKDKSLRYQTASALHKDLNRFLNTQYPEFSPHDFSVFMKSSFSQMFLDNRKKLVEYSKIQAETDDSSESTATATLTGGKEGEVAGLLNENSGMQKVDRDKLDLDLKNDLKVNLSELKAETSKEKSKSKIPIANANTGTRNNTKTGNASINKGYRRPVPKTHSNASSAFFIYLVVFVCLGGGGLILYRKVILPQIADVGHEETSTNGTTELSSIANFAMTIESIPSGARVLVDGRDLGATPLRIQMAPQKEFQLTLKKDGFLIYDSRQKAYQNGQSLRATLQPAPQVGYVSVDSPNFTADSIVYVNGQRLSERPPLRNYAVPANIPIKIEVVSPYTRSRAEKTISVGVNQRVDLRLVLERADRKPSNR